MSVRIAIFSSKKGESKVLVTLCKSFHHCFFINDNKTVFLLQVNHIYICDYHKNMIQNARLKRKRRDSDDADGSPEGDDDIPEVNTDQDL